MKISKNNNRRKLGFSLLELSIVILIVSTLIATSISVAKTNINSSKLSVTKAKMDVIYKSFTAFLAKNKRLPCPAVITTVKGSSSYDDEAATPGTCTNTYVSSTNAPNLVYGMIPLTALGLDPDMAEDGWGNKFTYVADKRFTKQSSNTASSDGFEITKGSPSENDTSTTDLSGIDIQGPSGTSLLGNKNGILLIISHGSDKSKGFAATSAAQNTTAGVADENQNSCDENSGCSTSGTTSFDRVFIAYSSDPGFDDILLYKTKSQMLKDAGLESVMCSAGEAQTASYSWTTNGNYGCNVCATTSNYAKTCGKYGSWSAGFSSNCNANASTCTTY